MCIQYGEAYIPVVIANSIITSCLLIGSVPSMYRSGLERVPVQDKLSFR